MLVFTSLSYSHKDRFNIAMNVVHERYVNSLFYAKYTVYLRLRVSFNI